MFREQRVRLALLSTFAALVLLLTSAGAAGASARQSTTLSPAGAASVPATQPSNPVINPADFVDRIDNRYFPLKPGTTFIYKGTKGGLAQRDVITVTHATKRILGVSAVVVRDRVTEEGELIELRFDWFAQDKHGNVWYFGEDSKEYENGVVVSTEGSWEAGVNGAQPGIVMEGHPRVGDSYRQEFAPDVAEDMAKVLSLTKSVSVPYGSFKHVLLTKEWTPLDPGVVEHKYYAPDIGFVLAISASEQERLELVDIKRGDEDGD
jgi:hypothetical protein